MNRFDLYGSPLPTVAETADRVAGATGLEFTLHDSDYIGPTCLAEGAGGLEVSVRENAVDEDGVAAEPEFAQHAVLVYVTGGDADLGEALGGAGLELLRSEEA